MLHSVAMLACLHDTQHDIQIPDCQTLFSIVLNLHLTSLNICEPPKHIGLAYHTFELPPKKSYEGQNVASSRVRNMSFNWSILRHAAYRRICLVTDLQDGPYNVKSCPAKNDDAWIWSQRSDMSKFLLGSSRRFPSFQCFLVLGCLIQGRVHHDRRDLSES